MIDAFLITVGIVLGLFFGWLIIQIIVGIFPGVTK